MKIAEFLAPLRSREAALVAETILLPAIALGVGLLLNPEDPVFSRGPFPWTWLAPVLIALRYGAAAGLGAAVVLLGGWYLLQTRGAVAGDFPKAYFLGGLMLVMLCGEFSAIWRIRVRRAEALQAYLDNRLEGLTQQHYFLRLSHDRLEQDLLARPIAMRDALVETRRIMQDAPENAFLPGAERLIRLLAQFCQLESAAIFAVDRGEVQTRPLSSIGPIFALDPGDALVRHALDLGQMCHVQTQGIERIAESRFVLAAPITTGDGTTRAVLVVQRIPFFALHEEMLQTLNLLLGYYAESLDARQMSGPIVAAAPACPLPFAFELQRLWRIRRDADVTSMLVALVIEPRPNMDDLPLQLRKQQRTLDVTWLIHHPTRSVYLTLMPLAQPTAAEGFLARIDVWARRSRGVSLEEAGIIDHVFRIDSADPVSLLQQVKAACHVPDDAWNHRADR